MFKMINKMNKSKYRIKLNKINNRQKNNKTILYIINKAKISLILSIFYNIKTEQENHLSF